MRIDTYAGAARRVPVGDLAGAGREAERILGVDAAFDGVTAKLDILLAEGQSFSGGDADLLLHDVDAGDLLGDRMLDLHARVHFDEVELAILVQELEGAGAAIADAPAGVGAALADPGDVLALDARRGRLLDDLLVTPLHRAVALAQVHRVAMLVGQHLDLDMARVLEELLHVHGGVAEGRAGLGLGHAHGAQQGRLGVHHAHAAPAPAAGGLDDDRIADVVGDAQDLLRIFRQRTFGARHAGHAGGSHGVLGAHLVAHQADGLGARTDEHEAGLFRALGEIGVLGQEAVARVDGLGVGDFGRRYQRRNVQIAQRGRGRADAHRLVGELDVLGLGVGLRMHGDGTDAELAAGTQDAESDLPPVGNENLLEHGRAQPMTNSGWPYSTG